ncbi:MAG: 16S rRNA (adenine(1518)-N(6)/adenine(1519)-N(6))-dimethyltransferase RsmA [Blastocatellia bacterium]
MQAKRKLGQNFLTGTHYPARIVRAVAPQADETIIEIGPGHGALTQLLVESGARVLAIELDRDLVPALHSRFAQHRNFQLIEADALEVDFCALIAPAACARVVANLPYNVATPILQRLVGHRSCITDLTLMFQREVVERLTAQPGGREYGYLSVLTQFYCRAEKLFDVPPGAFRPVPAVVSSVVRLVVREQTAFPVQDEKYFEQVVSALFAQRRKTILNNLKSARGRLALSDDEQLMTALREAGTDAQRRAETLTLEEMARLSDRLLRISAR